MRILVVSQAALYDRREADRCFALTAGLCTLGHEVRMVAPGTPAPSGVHIVAESQRLHAGHLAETWLATQAAADVLRGRPEIAMVFLSPAGSLAAPVLTGLRVPVVLAATGAFARHLTDKDPKAATFEAARQALRLATLKARAVIVPDDVSAELVQKHLGRHDAVHTVDDPSPLESAPLEDRGRAKRLLRIPESQRTITLAGPLVPSLRLDLLAEAHRHMPGVALIIAEDGAQRGFAEALTMVARPSCPVLVLPSSDTPAAERAASDTTRARAIRAADACVNLEPFHAGRVSKAYAAAGRRQVTFSTDDLDDLNALYPNEDAVSVSETRTAVGLREALSRVLSTESRRGPIPIVDVERVRTTLGWTRTAAKTATILRQCASSS